MQRGLQTALLSSVMSQAATGFKCRVEQRLSVLCQGVYAKPPHLVNKEELGVVQGVHCSALPLLMCPLFYCPYDLHRKGVVTCGQSAHLKQRPLQTEVGNDSRLQYQYYGATPSCPCGWLWRAP